MLKLRKTNALRLLGIGIAAPLLVHLLALPLAPLLIFTFALSYPMTVVVTLLLLLPAHIVFKLLRPTKTVQFLIVSFAGLVFGFAVYLVLFAPFPNGRFSASLAVGYALFGLLAAALSWVLYQWGPLRVEPVASEA